MDLVYRVFIGLGCKEFDKSWVDFLQNLTKISFAAEE
jgi:hypothetical protein